MSMTKLGKLGELTQSIWVKTNNFDKELRAGSLVEILDEYSDQGHWSDGDPYHVESPFPAYVIRYDGVKYESVHAKVVKTIS